MEQRLIDASAFDSKLTDDYHGAISDSSLYIYQILQLIDEQPTIDPVHAAGACYCKECKWKEKAKINKKGFLICPASGMEIADSDFCSYGERRTT